MRARLIKPGFYKSDELADLPPLARILFSGLWCLADRAGRLKDRPRTIKAEVLPYDECDIDAFLDALARGGFIIRYGAGRARFIQVVNFGKHQTPHVKELPSPIPAPDEYQTSPMPDRSLTNPDPDPGADPDPVPRESPAAPSRSSEPPYALFEALCEETGADEGSAPPAFKRKQLGKAKELLAQGYGSVEVRGCVRFLRSQDWRTSTIDLFTVAKEIGGWQFAGMPATAGRAPPKGRGQLSTQAVADEIDAVVNGARTHDDGSIEARLRHAHGRLAEPVRDPGGT